MARFVFRFVSGLFFPQEHVFNKFSALFFGLFGFVFLTRACVINNFSALFFIKGILLFFFVSKFAQVGHISNSKVRCLAELVFHSSLAQVSRWEGGFFPANTPV
jgi:hypothetical protein